MLVNLTRADIAAINAARDALAPATGSASKSADAIAAVASRIEKQIRKADDDKATHPFLHVRTAIQDWRINDNAAVTKAEIEAIEDLATAAHRNPWDLEVTQDAELGSLWIAATAPDGTQRSLSIEIDRGNLCASAFCNHDDALIRIALGDDAVYVQDQHTYGRHPNVEDQVICYDGRKPPRTIPGSPPNATLEGEPEEATL